ncbi:20456_t:CDS:2 [Gigaspora margarita]|uniref:20456_t:CDS:1 n=1 Tax=Gigaspora margarita TaxID=4874 RepID=A0ABN7VLD2_GIGMA|nr:20456_t:CDS:2 [Gigaspora margarita]
MLYVAPTSSEVQKNIKEYLKKCLKDIETKKKAQRCMILGDFNVDLNQIINLDLKEQAEKEGKKQIAQLLRGKQFADIFMNLTPQAHSRIDTIWVDYHWKQSNIFCKTKDMDLRTGQAENRRVRRKRLEIDIENVNKKDWEEYRAILNELWDIIESSIKKSAANTLPQKRKTYVIENIAHTDAVTKKLRKDIQTLGKWCRKLRKNKKKGISYQEVEELEHFIEPLKNQ